MLSDRDPFASDGRSTGYPDDDTNADADADVDTAADPEGEEPTGTDVTADTAAATAAATAPEEPAPALLTMSDLNPGNRDQLKTRLGAYFDEPTITDIFGALDDLMGTDRDFFLDCLNLLIENPDGYSQRFISTIVAPERGNFRHFRREAHSGEVPVATLDLLDDVASFILAHIDDPDSDESLGEGGIYGYDFRNYINDVERHYDHWHFHPEKGFSRTPTDGCLTIDEVFEQYPALIQLIETLTAALCTDHLCDPEEDLGADAPATTAPILPAEVVAAVGDALRAAEEGIQVSPAFVTRATTERRSVGVGSPEEAIAEERGDRDSMVLWDDTE